MDDLGDWRIVGIASGMSLSDHPNQDIESRKTHGLVKGVGELDDVLMDLPVLFLGHAESKQGGGGTDRRVVPGERSNGWVV